MDERYWRGVELTLCRHGMNRGHASAGQCKLNVLIFHISLSKQETIQAWRAASAHVRDIVSMLMCSLDLRIASRVISSEEFAAVHNFC